jgi:hypothetical protein
MDRSGSKFKNHLDNNLIHLHKNLYISTGDPLYYEKVIRYLDAHSPEAHFKLGQKNHKRGNLDKAQFHYQEVLRTYPSPFYSAANKALKQIAMKIGESRAAAETRASVDPAGGTRFPFMNTILIILLLLNVLVISLYFGADSISKTISRLNPWKTGADVTYETIDLPYFMYFPYETATEKVESVVHKQALALSKEQPKHNIQIYGLASSIPEMDEKVFPLKDDSLRSKAFVVAEYNAAMDNSVKIRFLDPDFSRKQPLSDLSANLVRTALHTYIQDNGNPPSSIDLLIQNYPHNYLSFVPLEISSHSNAVSSNYDGRGGWVYDVASGSLRSMFYPNVLSGTSPPYEPIHIEIVKSEHSLKLLSGSKIIMEKKVGLGANRQTPASSFDVRERVLNPQGSKPGVYGAAGLGLGKLAIHGTNDDSSVGSDQSLGCIRLSNLDITQLYAFVPKGTKVEIEDDHHAAGNADLELIKGNISEIIPVQLHPANEESIGANFHWLG